MSKIVRPDADTWIAAVYKSETGGLPLGAAVVIDARRLLTCTHVVADCGTPPVVWIAFPMTENPYRARIAATAEPSVHQTADVALLELVEDVPADVRPARVRNPGGQDLLHKHWWSFGFPEKDRTGVGNSADGTVGESLGYGWVRLDTDSRYLIERGFSGGGLWSPDYDAVVAVLGQANDRGDGRALPIAAIDRALPSLNAVELIRWDVEAAGVLALQSWGWTLGADPETSNHWGPRARGVTVDAELGFRFRGRASALTFINDWINRPLLDTKSLIVTGSPGVGKSAVLGRIITTADPVFRAMLPGDDEGITAVEGSIHCAVHAKGKTALEVAREIAVAASAALPQDVDDFVDKLLAALSEKEVARFNLVIDAVDEAESPKEARLILSKIVQGLTHPGAAGPFNLVVGTRTHDIDGDLLEPHSASFTLCDLDAPAFSFMEDLAEYASATLRLEGAERAANPYLEYRIARPVAERIARLSEGNYLVAGLIARSHALYDVTPIAPSMLEFDSSVDDAFYTYLDRIPPYAGIPARELLRPLAFAESPGFDLDLWLLAIHTLSGNSFSRTQLEEFARTSAASFILQTYDGHQTLSFRLFHQALAEALVRSRPGGERRDDETELSAAFVRLGRADGWSTNSSYLLRSLPTHAERGGLIDELLTDDNFLLHVDLRRLLPTTFAAQTSPGRDRAELIRFAREAVDAAPAEREAIFSLTAVMRGLRPFRTAQEGVPFRAAWGVAEPGVETAIVGEHHAPVNAICVVEGADSDLLASASDDGTVVVWDPSMKTEARVLAGHTGAVSTVCTLPDEDQAVLVSGGVDGRVLSWRLDLDSRFEVIHNHLDRVTAVASTRFKSQTLLASSSDITVISNLTDGSTIDLKGYTGRVIDLCWIESKGLKLLVTMSDDGVVRVWNPKYGYRVHLIRGFGWTTSICSFRSAGRALLACGDSHGSVQIWDVTSDRPEDRLAGARSRITAIAPADIRGHVGLVAATTDRALRLWNPDSRLLEGILEGHGGPARSITSLKIGDRKMLVSAGEDGSIRLWDPSEEKSSTRSSTRIVAPKHVVALRVKGRGQVAASSAEGNLTFWDARSGELVHNAGAYLGGYLGARALTVVRSNGLDLLAIARPDSSVVLWDPVSHSVRAEVQELEKRVFSGPPAPTGAMCHFPGRGGEMLATGTTDGRLQIIDVSSGRVFRQFGRHPTVEISALHSLGSEQEALLVSGSSDGFIRVWSLNSDRPLAELRAGDHVVRTLSSIRIDGRRLLVTTTGSDPALRLWDVSSRTLRGELHGHTGSIVATEEVIDSAGDSYLVSASEDSTLRVWLPSDAKVLRVIQLPSSPVALATTGPGTFVVALQNGLVALEVSL